MSEEIIARSAAYRQRWHEEAPRLVEIVHNVERAREQTSSDPRAYMVSAIAYINARYGLCSDCQTKLSRAL